MEGLIRDGEVDAVLDLTTTESPTSWSAGSSRRAERLRPRRGGIPQVVSVGALDMVNFGGDGPRALRPTLSPAQPLGDLDADHARTRTLRSAGGSPRPSPGRPSPRRSCSRCAVSRLDAPGRPFHDPEANRPSSGRSTRLDAHPLVTVLDCPSTSTTPGSPTGRRCVTSGSDVPEPEGTHPMNTKSDEILGRFREKVAARQPIVGGGRRHRHLGQVRRGAAAST